ncbi:MAG: helix-turn-helix domain-containing protein [Candidatus Heimdallarchaeota archaeon]
MEGTGDASRSNGRQILFDFWEKLPVALFIETPRDKVLGHKARLPILRILRDGIVEPPPGQTLKRRRHGLNAQEILKELQKHEDPKVQKLSLQSLYHHLEGLEEAGLIRPITVLREEREKRKTRVAYYGRTARGFLFSEALKEEKRFRQLAELAKLARATNADFEEAKAEAILKRFLKLQRERLEHLFEWITKNEPFLFENSTDFSYVFDFLILLDSVNPEYKAIFKELLEVLKLDLETVLWK